MTVVPGIWSGNLAVTSHGGISYDIPLELPPGAGAVHPVASLQYHTGGGNGPFGVGWSLSNVSSITRCPASYASAGRVAPITMTPTDRLCLDGVELKLVSGSYGGTSATYATEVESFANVVASSDLAGSAPASFDVIRNDGLRYRYGANGARMPATGTPVRWNLQRVVDRAGNAMEFQYETTATSGQRLASMSYPITAQGQGPLYRIAFDYEARPDQELAYVAGIAQPLMDRVHQIVVEDTIAQTRLANYELQYAPGPDGRSQLQHLQRCDGADQCLAPIRVTYDATTPTTTRVAPLPPLAIGHGQAFAMDADGDGRQDRAICRADAPDAACRWSISFTLADGTVREQVVPLGGQVSLVRAPATAGRLRGQLRDQLVIAVGPAEAPTTATYWAVDYAAATGTFELTSLGVSALGAGAVRIIDADGDGMGDLATSNGQAVTLWKNTAAPGGTLTLGASQSLFVASANGTIGDAISYMPGRDGQGGIDVADWNGDGRQDVAVTEVTYAGAVTRLFASSACENGACAVGAYQHVHTIVDRPRFGFMPLEWNGDGCADYLLGNGEWAPASVHVSDCMGGFQGLPLVPMSAWQTTRPLIVDLDADGADNILYYSEVYTDAQRNDVFDRTLEATTSADGTMTFDDAPLTDIIGEPRGAHYASSEDTNADGRPDIVIWPWAPQDAAAVATAWRTSRVLGTRALTFATARGIDEVTYRSMSTPGLYQARSDAAFPLVDVASVAPIVASIRKPDGAGGTYTNTYAYRGARLHAQGRGFVGMSEQQSTDSRDGSTTVTTFAQTFPHVGRRISETVLFAGAPLFERRTTLETRQLESASGEKRFLPLTVGSAATTWELATPTLPARPVRNETTVRDVDAYGNVTSERTMLTDMDAASPFVGETYATTTQTTYDTNATTWCLGMPRHIVTRRSATGVPDIINETSFVNDVNNCRVQEQITEPNDNVRRTSTSYTYDVCGNVNQLTLGGRDETGALLAPRATSTNYGVRCQFAEVSTDPTNTTSRKTFDAMGRVTASVDPNGLTTSYAYDGFGRLTRRSNPDGTRVEITRQQGPSAGWTATSTTFDAGGAEIISNTETIDANGRIVREVTVNPLSGETLVSTDITYDGAGRSRVELLPYTPQTPSKGTIRTTYDVLGRVEAQSEELANGTRRSLLAYNGNETKMTSPLGATRTTRTDARGLIRHKQDPVPGGLSEYSYDAAGRVTRIVGPAGATYARTYDAAGRLVSEVDPNSGETLVRTNSLGEPVAVRNAKGQWTHSRFDEAGRVVARSYDAWLSTDSWTYGNDPQSHNVGQLVRVEGANGYREEYAYDALGRLASNSVTHSGRVFQYDLGYNALGLLDAITYPETQAGARLRIQYAYSRGTLARVLGPAGQVLWQADAMDEARRLTRETVLSTALTRTFVPRSGLLEATRATNAAGVVQDARYTWDADLNLQRRDDSRAGLWEAFAYDPLARLVATTSNRATPVTVAYDRAGNVATKSDVGAYEYADPAHPNAVTKAGDLPMAYDANGNLITRGTSQLEWSPDNLLLGVTTGGAATTFKYSPDRTRISQQIANGAMILYAGLFEQQADTAGVTWRHTIPTAGGAHVVASASLATGPGTFTYAGVLKDHMGSTDVVVDASGNVLSRESYDAFGARRNGDWSLGRFLTDLTRTTQRGYTGHEMLDDLGLIHMNARVYDPRLGRFLSVDPVLQPSSQALNGYGYASGRFLSVIDPTGMSDDPLGDAVVDVPQSVATQALDAAPQVIVITGSRLAYRAGIDYIDSDTTCRPLVLTAEEANAQRQLAVDEMRAVDQSNLPWREKVRRRTELLARAIAANPVRHVEGIVSGMQGAAAGGMAAVGAMRSLTNRMNGTSQVKVATTFKPETPRMQASGPVRDLAKDEASPKIEKLLKNEIGMLLRTGNTFLSIRPVGADGMRDIVYISLDSVQAVRVQARDVNGP